MRVPSKGGMVDARGRHTAVLRVTMFDKAAGRVHDEARLPRTGGELNAGVGSCVGDDGPAKSVAYNVGLERAISRGWTSAGARLSTCRGWRIVVGVMLTRPCHCYYSTAIIAYIIY